MVSTQLVIVILYLCGAAFAKVSKESRIVKGTNANICDASYTVSLRLDGKHICGGVLIGLNWVLTAASCLRDNLGVNVDKSKLSIVAGATNLDSLGQYGSSSSAKMFIIHGSYNSNNYDNNIAMVKITNIILINKCLSFILLNLLGIGSGDSVSTYGWGRTSSSIPTFSNTLQSLSQTTIQNNVCAMSYNTLTNNQICARSTTGSGSCGGDGGNPLVRNGLLIGILSHNANCDASSPDVYTRIAPYTGWITTNKFLYALS